jgi:unsaturated rhamnogalacturonyl hydrolase
MALGRYGSMAVAAVLGLAVRAGLGQVTGMAPAAGATDVPVNVKLEWKAVEGAKGYEVYFGEVPAVEKDMVMPAYQCRVSKPAFVLETLSAGKGYRWRVDVVPAAGETKAGAIQVFSTVAKADRDAMYAWPIRMADTIRGLYPTPERVGDWNYTQGMVCDALVSIAVRTGRDKDIDFARAWADRFVQADGTVTSGMGQPFDVALHSLDRIRPAPLLLWLYDRTKEEKYKKAAVFMAGLLDQQPKTSDGGYWHRQTYPNQMWLDGIYMADVFGAEYAGMMKDPKHFDEAVKQILLIAKHTRDEKTGLFYHGWDETKTRPWANKDTGASPEFWGRAMGWYGMAMADVLEWLPADHPGRAEVQKVFKGFCEAVAKVQDKETGMWWQILDKPTGPKNYVETSCSIMFSYALAKGAQHGWIGPEYLEAARRGTRGVMNKELDFLAGGRVDIKGTVVVGSLGGNGGFYDYYVGVQTTTNDQKSLGAMMYLSLAMSEIAAGAKVELPRKGP